MTAKFPTVLAVSALACLSLAGCQREPAQAPHQQTAQPSSSTPPAPASQPAAPATPADTMVTKFQAFGTEPFWAVDIDGDKATYKTPDNQTGVNFNVARTAFAKGVEFNGVMEGKAVTIAIKGGPCSDGMSDLSHEFTVIARIGEQTLNGCARRR